MMSRSLLRRSSRALASQNWPSRAPRRSLATAECLAPRALRTGFPPIADLLRDFALNSETISERPIPYNMVISPPDPSWPQSFIHLQALILSALGSTALSISHTGSTSVPHLPAKAIIDIDITVSDPRDEALYVPQLKAAGFHFLSRNPLWHENRLFSFDGPCANLHIFPTDAPAIHRNLIFRDWLREHPEDRKWYAATKLKVMQRARERGKDIDWYTSQKSEVIDVIIGKALRGWGYVH